MTNTEIRIWEEAWSEYIDALKACDADWSGPDFVIDIAREKRRLQDAEQNLRSIDANFCNLIGI